jgi:hypothetical protein
LFGYLDPVRVEADNFARMIGQQADGVKAEIREDLRGMVGDGWRYPISRRHSQDYASVVEPGILRPDDPIALLV